MHTLDITITVDGQPAKRVYVEHTAIGIPIGLYMTDDRGRVRDNARNLGIDSFTSTADIRILGQNSVARVLRGSGTFILESISVDKFVDEAKTTIDLNTDKEHANYFRILNQAIENYDNIHRQFQPFSGLRNADFPLGRLPTLQATKDQSKRIEIVYPDNLPIPAGRDALSFVEPKSLSTGYPLIHLKNNDGRLFGEVKTLIPSEFSHALHFSMLTPAGRDRVTIDYVTFLASRLLETGDASHDINMATSHLVAYVEAMDHFSSRYSEFLRKTTPKNTGAARYYDFIYAELEAGGDYWLSKDREKEQVGTFTGSPKVIVPKYKGSDREGAIYGAIFLDFARRVTPGIAVSAYFLSGAVTFGEYRQWMYDKKPDLKTAIDIVADTWDL